nr:uncharacterized protein CI109_001412 [Kwoniella shandongensis]KAA5530009.1 hypothetical protein CI109_001412 [Kwoniella shandongensis]
MTLWFLRGYEEGSQIERRGGSGQGITTTATHPTSYLPGPPSSTATKWHGTGKEPQIAGSTGGFIGLISGIAIVVLVSLFAGVYFWNRYRRRIGPKSSNDATRTRSHNPLPSLSFSRPSTSNDPYADTAEERTPKASKFGFTRPVYARQRSSEWDMPMYSNGEDDSPPAAATATKAGEGGWVNVNSTREARPVSPTPLLSTPTKAQSKGKGKERLLSRQESNSSISKNPFDNPYDDSRLSPIAYRDAHRSQTSVDSLDIGAGQGAQERQSYLRAGDSRGDDDGSSGGESEGERSIRVSQIREGTRFVERFESKESLA